MAEPIRVELTLDLDRHINHGYRQVSEDGYVPEPATVESLIIEEAARQLLVGATEHNAPDVRGGLRTRVEAIRDEEIRKRVVPLIEKALAAPLRKTNHYGDATGPETTLRDLVVEEARNILNGRDTRGNTLGRATSLIQSLVETEVKAALTKEFKEAIEAARAELVETVRAQGAAILAETIRRTAGKL